MVVERLEALGEVMEPYRSAFSHILIDFDIEMLKYALDCLIEKSGVTMLLESHMISAEVNDRVITNITCADDEGLFTVSAHVFVDATGDANLAHLAGVETVFGEDGKVQMASLVLWIGGIDRNAEYKQEELETAIIKAKEAGIGPLTKSKAIAWIATKGDRARFALPNYALKGLDAENLTHAACDTRKQAQAYVNALRTYMPGMENCYLAQSGPRIGIRESRRVVCQKLLRNEDAMKGVKPQDSIARSGWPFEIHDRLDMASSDGHVEDHSYFGIPLGCLKAVDTPNLWCAGRNIYVDRQTLGSVRVMGTGFATGQAAGVAAALTGSSADYDIEAIQKELLRQGAIPL